MDHSRVLSALCYFSILFAPFLLPVIVFFIAHDEEVKLHAKRSLLSHLIPVGLGIIGFLLMIAVSFQSMNMNYYDPYGGSSGLFWAAGLPFLFMIGYVIVSLIVTVWNIFQGVKVLR